MSLLTHFIVYNQIHVNTTLTTLKTHISIQKYITVASLWSWLW